MATQGYVTVEGFSRILRSLPKETSKQLRDEAQAIAGDIAQEAQERARAIGGLAKYLAPSIKAKRDRVPVVTLGSRKKLPATGEGWQRSRSGPGQTLADVKFGAEFGGGARPSTRQFLPHKGTIGYFLYPAVRDEAADALKRYSEALRRALVKA